MRIVGRLAHLEVVLSMGRRIEGRLDFDLDAHEAILCELLATNRLKSRYRGGSDAVDDLHQPFE